MNFYLCPRCHFRVGQNKPMCPTCGYKIPAARESKSSGASASEQKESLKSAFLGRLMNNLEKNQEQNKPDSPKENPALS